jgi:hypothetical protein
MAGEWIKLEAATLEKPEVMRMARLLQLPREHVIGLLIRFWVWLDKNCVDGVVDGVESLDVDDLMTCPGLSACLKDVGWVQINDQARVLTVINFMRHNGETAKKRALKNERQSRWRAKSVDAPASTSASTREEKRRVSISTNVDIERSKPAVLQAPTAEHEALATKVGVPCQAEFQKYRDYLAASGKRHKDQDAGFRNWLRKAGEWKPRVVANAHEKRSATARAMYGDRLAKPDDAIDGTAERVA